jgi:hypothetical protein
MQDVHLKLNPGFPWRRSIKKRSLSSTNELNLRVKLVKCYICNIALYGAENLTLRE